VTVGGAAVGCLAEVALARYVWVAGSKDPLRSGLSISAATSDSDKSPVRLARRTFSLRSDVPASASGIY